jgi:hypothetical protein
MVVGIMCNIQKRVTQTDDAYWRGERPTLHEVCLRLDRTSLHNIRK